jgi:hypothetical protein
LQRQEADTRGQGGVTGQTLNCPVPAGKSDEKREWWAPAGFHAPAGFGWEASLGER